jgi:hypothetical protein
VVLIDLVTCFKGLAVAKVARFPKVRILFAKFPPQKYSFLRGVRQKCFGKSLRNKRKRMFWEKKEGGYYRWYGLQAVGKRAIYGAENR